MTMRDKVVASLMAAAGGMTICMSCYIAFVPNPKGPARAEALNECISRFTDVGVNGPIFKTCQVLSLHPKMIAAAIAAMKAAGGAAKPCIGDSAEPPDVVAARDFMTASYKAARCEERARPL
jgi:hypothetical protein